MRHSMAEWSSTRRYGGIHYAIIGELESCDGADGEGGGGAGSCGGRREVISVNSKLKTKRGGLGKKRRTSNRVFSAIIR